ncbi:MAG: hypothetical protein ACK57B_14640 [Betaproteobacteria bacterium]
MKSLRVLTTLAAAALLTLAAASMSHAQGVRAEVGKPLQQASDLLRAGKAREALAKAREADAVGGKTAAEQLLIDRMKAAAAQRANDFPTAIAALEAVHPKVSGAEAGQIAEQLAAAYAQTRNNAKATEWVNKAVAAGNSSATLRQLQQFLLSNSGDFNAIARDAAAAVQAAEQGGRRPGEDDLLRLADAQNRLGQTNAYVATLEKLLLNYPKKDYWSAYLGRLARKSGFSQRLELDVLRLRLASGTLTKTEEYMEMAQLSLQAGFPAEARRIVEQGYANKLLGTGPEAGRHQRLRDLAVKQEADSKASIGGLTTEAEQATDGDALVKWGYASVTLGDFDKGLAIIQQGLAMPGLKRPDEARLRLGMAQIQSAKTRAAGLQTLRAVRGADGTADIARLWTAVQP